MQTLNIDYRGADIRVELEVGDESRDDQGYPARLKINGIERDKAILRVTGDTVRLATPVQTDYEWHEHIEAVITLRSSEALIAVSANQQPLESLSIAL